MIGGRLERRGDGEDRRRFRRIPWLHSLISAAAPGLSLVGDRSADATKTLPSARAKGRVGPAALRGEPQVANPALTEMPGGANLRDHDGAPGGSMRQDLREPISLGDWLVFRPSPYRVLLVHLAVTAFIVALSAANSLLFFGHYTRIVAFVFLDAEENLPTFFSSLIPHFPFDPSFPGVMKRDNLSVTTS
jgi:hypothetical protein